MPPKFMFNREQLIDASLNIIRRGGPQSLTARSLAGELGCSVKPIFGLFKNMEEVRLETIKAADRIYRRYIGAASHAEEKPYKAMGMAYIRFATEEKELFKLLFMRDRSAENINDDSGKDVTEAIVKLISKNTGLNEKTAYMLHLETWLYVHGIATMIATNYLEWDGKFVSNALTDCYTGLLHRFKTKAVDVIS